jgi:photoactive yellow protein
MQFVPGNVLSSLGSLSRSQADSFDFGVVKVDDSGVIQLYNKYESELAGVAPATAEGKNFFTHIAPCTNNRLFYGRFKDGVAADSLNVTLPYTFTYKMKPTNVLVQMYRDSATKTNWVFVKKR